ncbi:DUF397 domain-containing protein [Nocardia huaxiensis]|uniref:DUF397 domain-containing protein n=1 Tax=Nocardia huaxiensis TaxID=2755382 RepID=UPI001E5E1F6F|nr:DUF397 domain-containing protein [Nocardia huaxiensis]UFS99589.1 DUF397 domain-containing protein [Nocardia huaxiensis]
MNGDLSEVIWFKSSHSSAGGECVEIAHFEIATGVRDSKHPGGPELKFARLEWAAFIEAASAGKFDL